MTLSTAIEEFKFHCIYEKNLSTKTIKAYDIDLAQFIQFEQNKDLLIENIEKDILKKYVQNLFARELKEKSIKRKIATLKALFNFLEFEEHIEITPFRKLRLKIKEPKRLPKTVSLKDIRKLLKYMYKLKTNYHDSSIYSYRALVRDIAVIELLFSTGVRVAEMCSLTNKNLHIVAGTITIVGKGDKERKIHIPDINIKAILREYLELQHSNSTQWLLTNRLGERLSEQSVRFMVKKYCQQANIEQHITPHMFRHSFATLLLEEGVDIRYIQHMLGHASISTTQIYTQVNLRHQKKILTTKHPRRFMNLNEG